jgi:DNA-binding cell septation regulator SpoVG
VISRITDVQFSRTRSDNGLLGFVSFVLDGDLQIDGVALRRTLLGELTISWPGRRDAAGRLHHHVRPVDGEVRRELEDELLARLHPFVRGGAA